MKYDHKTHLLVTVIIMITSTGSVLAFDPEETLSPPSVTQKKPSEDRVIENVSRETGKGVVIVDKKVHKTKNTFKSAADSAKQARDRKPITILPLRGKILNVTTATG